MFTGRIDNRDDLLRSSLSGKVNPACDDATLYAWCHAEFGDLCDLRLIGQYAAILWTQERNQIRLARSPISGPPLHIWQGEDTAIIASTPRAIFATGEVRQEVDDLKIADSLYLNYAEAERGWFKGISRLPVNTRATVTATGMQSTLYYDPFAKGPVRFPKDDDYVDAANALFDDATRAALRGASKPAIALSGGLDSQAVAASVLSQIPSDASLFSFTSVPCEAWDGRAKPNKFGDERTHVEAFAAMQPRLTTNFVDAEGLSFDHKLDAMFLMVGAPPRNAMNLHWMHEGMSLAKSSGCDVVLHGSSGNATFSFNGNGAFPGWALGGNWMTLLREVWAGRRRHKSLAHAFAGNVIRPLLPHKMATQLRRLRFGAHANPFDTWCPLNAEWADAMELDARAAQLGFDAHFLQPRSTQSLRRALFNNASNEAGDLVQALEALHGIPMRDPSSYRPLVEFCFNIPDDQYIRGGQSRWLAQRMLKGKLPDKVLSETRRGQQTADWHARLSLQLPALRDEVDALSRDDVMAEMLNLPRLRRMLENWPDETPTSPSDPNASLHLALTRALTTARFIKYVKGGNS
ncbi:MAG: asparagine synthetase B family protein [Gymnodinialimonas sp.]